MELRAIQLFEGHDVRLKEPEALGHRTCAGVVPSHNTRHSSARLRLAWEYMAPRHVATVSPSSAWAVSFCRGSCLDSLSRVYVTSWVAF